MTSNENHLNKEIVTIRSKIPILKKLICFNTGMDGPIPTVSLKAINQSLEIQYKKGTFTREGIEAVDNELSETKQNIAAFFNTSSKNICLASCTTSGINIALNRFNWKSSDEIITSKGEYSSILFALYNLREIYKVKIKLLDLDKDNPLETIKKNISGNTKLVLLSHIFYKSGICLHELKEILGFLRKKNIISVIDGAQSAGAVKINLSELQPDFFSAPGQKWLLGPIGTGFLYVNEQWWPPASGFSLNWKPRNDANLFEFGGLNCSLFSGLSTSITFLKDSLEKINIYKQVYKLSEYLREQLNDNKNIRVITSKYHGGIISWQHKTIPSSVIVQKLWKKRMVIREIAELNLCRTSVHFFNTKDEIDLLVDFVNSITS